MSDRKKQWSKPQLIVLGRGKPEENVLGPCKNLTTSGPTTVVGGCYSEFCVTDCASAFDS